MSSMDSLLDTLHNKSLLGFPYLYWAASAILSLLLCVCICCCMCCRRGKKRKASQSENNLSKLQVHNNSPMPKLRNGSVHSQSGDNNSGSLEMTNPNTNPLGNRQWSNGNNTQPTQQNGYNNQNNTSNNGGNSHKNDPKFVPSVKQYKPERTYAGLKPAKNTNFNYNKKKYGNNANNNAQNSAPNENTNNSTAPNKEFGIKLDKSIYHPVSVKNVFKAGQKADNHGHVYDQHKFDKNQNQNHYANDKYGNQKQSNQNQRNQNSYNNQPPQRNNYRNEQNRYANNQNNHSQYRNNNNHYGNSGNQYGNNQYGNDQNNHYGNDNRYGNAQNGNNTQNQYGNGNNQYQQNNGNQYGNSDNSHHSQYGNANQNRNQYGNDNQYHQNNQNNPNQYGNDNHQYQSQHNNQYNNNGYSRSPQPQQSYDSHSNNNGFQPSKSAPAPDTAQIQQSQQHIPTAVNQSNKKEFHIQKLGGHKHKKKHKKQEKFHAQNLSIVDENKLKKQKSLAAFNMKLGIQIGDEVVKEQSNNSGVMAPPKRGRNDKKNAKKNLDSPHKPMSHLGSPIHADGGDSYGGLSAPKFRRPPKVRNDDVNPEDYSDSEEAAKISHWEARRSSVLAADLPLGKEKTDPFQGRRRSVFDESSSEESEEENNGRRLTVDITNARNASVSANMGNLSQYQ